MLLLATLLSELRRTLSAIPKTVHVSDVRFLGTPLSHTRTYIQRLKVLVSLDHKTLASAMGQPSAMRLFLSVRGVLLVVPSLTLLRVSRLSPAALLSRS